MKIIMIAKRTINTKLKINTLSDLHSLLQQQQQQTIPLQFYWTACISFVDIVYHYLKHKVSLINV